MLLGERVEHTRRPLCLNPADAQACQVSSHMRSAPAGKTSVMFAVPVLADLSICCIMPAFPT